MMMMNHEAVLALQNFGLEQYMGQILQDGENGCFKSYFFFKSRAFV